MRRRHIASYTGEKMTLCGHSATIQEFKRMKTIKVEDVTCKRCLNILKREEELSTSEEKVTTNIVAKT
mgnify:FL=1